MKNITFINAGAGSGKTFRLTEELYKSIYNKDCKANEVLLTTFTKKAAEEIKIKAREKLLEEGLNYEANGLQNAYIGTIHSVGSQVIKKFWHFIGFPKEIRIMDVNDTNFYFNQAIANIPTDSELAILNEINYRFNPIGGEFNSYNPKKWTEDLLRIIELARANHIVDFTNSRNISIAKAKTILNTDGNIIDLEVIKDDIQILIEIGNQLPARGNGVRKKNIQELRKINSDNIKYIDLFKIKKVIDDLLHKQLDQGELQNSSNVLEKIHRSRNLLDDIEEYNDLLFGIAERSIDQYKKFKQDAGLIDYTDMEEGFLQLLEFEEVQEEIRDTIKLVLVDEFQDSSPIQLAIFIKLSDIIEKNIWVGDPKQSIFGFRGTDPELINEIIKEFDFNKNDNLNTENLPYSWRSRPEIVALINNIFTPALKNQIPKEKIPLIPVRTDKRLTEPALHHYNLVGEKPTSQNYYHALVLSVVKLLNEDWVVSDKNKSVPSINKEAEEVTTRELKPIDIAILCKTNSVVEIISAKLLSYGIQISAEISGLEKTAEYKLVIALIKLIISHQNSLAKAEIRVLTEPNYGTSELINDRLSFLDKLPTLPIKPSEDNIENRNDYSKALLEFNKGLNDYYQNLNDWGQENILIKEINNVISEIIELPVPQLIEELISRLDLHSFVSSWGNASQRKENLQKIIEYGYQYDERCLNLNLGASLSGFIQFIDKLPDKNEGATKDENSVNVLTYHKAKGLEWSIVILADLQKDINFSFISREIFGVSMQSEDKIDLNNILSNRYTTLIPWPFGAGNTKVSDDFQNHLVEHDIYDQAKEKQDNELKRLLYVGMTRARDYLITTGISGQKKYPWMNLVNKHNNWDFHTSSDIESSVVDIFDRGNPIRVHKLRFEDDSRQIIPSQSVLSFSEKKFNQIRKAIPYYISPSAVKFEGNEKVSLYKEIQGRIPIGKSLNDREDDFGSCLHDILYLYLGDKIMSPEPKIVKEIEKLIINYNLDEVLNFKDVIESIDNFHDLIQSEFKPTEWYRELALEIEIDGQLFNGEIDLLLEVDEGYILIDYKSYPGSISQVLDRSKNNFAGKYAGQLDAYTKMIEALTNRKVLHKFIYYTVLGKLIEIIY